MSQSSQASSILSTSRYGKAKVRVLKVVRTPGAHQVYDMNVRVLLTGPAFHDTYLTGNNASVVATDTMKNTCYIVAEKSDYTSLEEYALLLGEHFITTYAHVEKALIKIEQFPWQRIQAGTQPHEHSFQRVSPEVRTVSAVIGRAGSGSTVDRLESGVSDLLVLKTTGSGFEGYIQDKYTTLKETSDRIFSTAVKAKWSYNVDVKNTKVNFNQLTESVRSAVYEVFALEYSKSVQETLYRIGDLVLKRSPEIASIWMSMPNKHAFTFDFSRFESCGVRNTNSVFQPIDAPSGLIEGTVSRSKAEQASRQALKSKL